MNIVYSQEKNFDAKTLLDFFTKSGNPDAKYGEALVKAVENSTVFHAWDKEANELAALISVIDDGATTAYIRYLIVAPNYRGKGLNDPDGCDTMEKNDRRMNDVRNMHF